jgi:hypothetical protein
MKGVSVLIASVLIATPAVLGATTASATTVDAPIPGSLVLLGTALLGLFGLMVAGWTLRG